MRVERASCIAAVTLTGISITIGLALAIFAGVRGSAAARQFLLGGHKKFAVLHGYMLLACITIIIDIASFILLRRRPRPPPLGVSPAAAPDPAPPLIDPKLIDSRWIPRVVEAFAKSVLCQMSWPISAYEEISSHELGLMCFWLQEEFNGMGLDSSKVFDVSLARVDFSRGNRFINSLTLRKDIGTHLPTVVVDICMGYATTPLSRALAEANDEVQKEIDSQVQELLSIIEPHKAEIKPAMDKEGHFHLIYRPQPNYPLVSKQAACKRVQEILQKEYKEYRFSLSVCKWWDNGSKELILKIYRRSIWSQFNIRSLL